MEFKVRTNKIKGTSADIGDVAIEIRRTGETVRAVMNGLTIHDESFEVIRSKLDSSCTALNESSRNVRALARALESVSLLYETTEKKIADNAAGISGPDYQQIHFHFEFPLISGALLNPGLLNAGTAIIGILGYNDELDRIKDIATIKSDVTVGYDSEKKHLDFDMTADGSKYLEFEDVVVLPGGRVLETKNRPLDFDLHMDMDLEDGEGRFAPAMNADYNVESGFSTTLTEKNGSTHSFELGMLSGSGVAVAALVYDEKGRVVPVYEADTAGEGAVLRFTEHTVIGDKDNNKTYDRSLGLGTLEYEFYGENNGKGPGFANGHAGISLGEANIGIGHTVNGINTTTGISGALGSFGIGNPVDIDSTDTGFSVSADASAGGYGVGVYQSVDFGDTEINEVRNRYRETLNNYPFYRMLTA